LTELAVSLIISLQEADFTDEELLKTNPAYRLSQVGWDGVKHLYRDDRLLFYADENSLQMP